MANLFLQCKRQDPTNKLQSKHFATTAPPSPLQLLCSILYTDAIVPVLGFYSYNRALGLLSLLFSTVANVSHIAQLQQLQRDTRMSYKYAEIEQHFFFAHSYAFPHRL